ncbi:MAG: S1 RNA-binding domain-containing protein [Blastocatellia bacterium]
MLGLVKDVNAQGADVTFGMYHALVTAAETKWTNKTPAVLFKKGDLAYFSVVDVDREENRCSRIRAVTLKFKRR